MIASTHEKFSKRPALGVWVAGTEAIRVYRL
jgi:hypothetical protein